MAMGGQGLALVIATYGLEMTLPWGPVASTIGVLAGFTVITGWWARRAGSVSDGMFTSQLLADVGALTVVLYFTGGSANPLAPLFLLPITLAAATLRGPSKWLVTTAAIMAYTGLMFWHVPLPALGNVGRDFAAHIWGMWGGFVLSAALVAYFVSKIGSTLRRHDRALAEAREEALRADQALALGTLAAGTAHELGTPLATIAVLAKELEHECDGDVEQVAKLRLLRSQIDRCKKILARMTSEATSTPANGARRVPVERYLDGLLQEWGALRSEVSAKVRWNGVGPGPEIVADRMLTQAIMSVLDNAADASAQTVEVEGSWSESELRIEVRDRGRGIPAAVRGHIGEPGVTDKSSEDGLGLGLFLARTSLDRLGGRLRLRDRSGGGVCAEIALPLSALLARDGRRP
ncbi:MAG: ATP-binding protein [Myxococcota bacterium]